MKSSSWADLFQLKLICFSPDTATVSGENNGLIKQNYFVLELHLLLILS